VQHIENDRGGNQVEKENAMSLSEGQVRETVGDALKIAVATPQYKGPIVELFVTSNKIVAGVRDEDGVTKYVNVALEPVEGPPVVARAEEPLGAQDASPEEEDPGPPEAAQDAPEDDQGDAENKD
jgi:hypothetical protein